MKLNGIDITDFDGYQGYDANTKTYTVDLRNVNHTKSNLKNVEIPKIVAQGLNNEAITILPLYNNEVKIIVKSEDGQTTETYTVHFMIPVNKEPLYQYIESSDIKNVLKSKDDYTEESYKEFKKAYDYAINLLNSESSLQEQIDKSLNELQNAYQRLVKKIGHKVDKSQLESIILKAEKIPEETLKKSDTKIVQEFKSALQKAKQIYNNGEATQLEVNDAVTLLSKAIDHLKINNIDKTALQELIKQVVILNAKDYTLSSWKKLEKALANAQSVFKDEKATTEQIMSAEEQLKTALQHLKKVSIEQTSTTPQKGSSANTSDSTYFVGVIALVTSILVIAVCLRYKKD